MKRYIRIRPASDTGFSLNQGSWPRYEGSDAEEPRASQLVREQWPQAFSNNNGQMEVTALGGRRVVATTGWSVKGWTQVSEKRWVKGMEKVSDRERDQARSLQDKILAIVDRIPNSSDSLKVAENMPMTIGDLRRFIYPAYLSQLEMVLQDLKRR